MEGAHGPHQLTAGTRQRAQEVRLAAHGMWLTMASAAPVQQGAASMRRQPGQARTHSQTAVPLFPAPLPARSLRALYGTDGTRNATHGSDSPTSTAREIAFFFPSLVAEPLPDPGAAQAYIVSHLQPTLVHALTELAKQKPASTPAEAITFLAGWLLDNNPNKPKVVAPAAGAGAGPVVAAQAGSGSISAVLGSKAQRCVAKGGGGGTGWGMGGGTATRERCMVPRCKPCAD